jgi:hypothetical protein
MSSSATTDVSDARGANDLRERLKRALASRAAIAWLVALGVLLMTPALGTGLQADDYVHAVVLRKLPTVAPPEGAWDLFRFANGDPRVSRALMDAGEFSWSADPNVRFAFFRPLSALTHILDYKVWPTSPWMMHAHSLVWLALALFGAALVYRRLLGATWIAGLATLLYAVDDTHGPAVGWIANRNAVIAIALSLPVLWLHDRWRRDGWKPGAWLAPLLLLTALLAGESSLAIVAYLAAYALHVDRAPLRARILSLVPCGAAVLAWRAVYSHMGYGTSGSGVYFDPGHDPIAYLGALPQRLPLLLLGQFGLPWSDFAALYEFVSRALEWKMIAFAVVVLGLLAWAFTPLLRRDPVARFFATGLVLSALPACATFPGDRLLFFVSVGAMGLIAQLLASAASARERVAAVCMIVVHLVIAPPMLAFRARTMIRVEAVIDVADNTIPRDPGITNKTVVLLNPPNDVFGAFVPAMRSAMGVPRPARFRVLASGTSEVAVTRVDAQTLRVRPARGFLEHDSERLLRSVAHRPFKQGEEIPLAGMTATVTEATSDGRPAEVLFHFDVPLEDPSLVWLCWGEEGYVPCAPPAVGTSETLPAHDFLRAALDANLRAKTY